MKKHAVVIGAGFGGLATACYLAKDGYAVTILEKNEGPGGRAGVWKTKGYTFDMGPSWYLMPDVFEQFFAAFGKKPSDYYALSRLKPAYRIYFGKDSHVEIPASLPGIIKLFDRFEPNGGKKLQEYLRRSKEQYEIAMKDFIERPYESWKELLDPRLATQGPKLHVFESMDRYTRRFFQSDQARKVLMYNLVFLGGSPENTPALYNIMAHVDFSMGVWYPVGGFGSVVEGMVSLARELGVRLKYNQEVSRILVKEGQVTGVRVGETVIKADIVVANADYPYVEMSLLPARYRTYSASYWKKKTLAPSAFILYLGLKKKIKGLEHHMLMLEHDWVKHFDEIFKKPTWPDAPSYYVCCPSIVDPSVAPPGKENLFVLVPVASGLQDDDTLRKEYAEKIIRQLEETTGTSIRPHIEVQRIFSQRDFTSRYHAYQGTALGLSHTLFQTALFRPRNRSPKVRGLFFTGQFTNPGIGVPIALISGKIVRGLVQQYA